MTAFIDPERFSEEIARLGRGFAITRGEYRFPSHCSVRDLDWNFMDQAHRRWVHGTYQDALRIHLHVDFAISLTRVPLGPFKPLVLLTDVRLGPGLFYQMYCLFSLIYVHGVLRNNPEGTIFEWHIVSSRFLRFLHPLLSRRIWKLNHVQIADDVPIRVRRAELRKRGYAFGPEEEDFLTSNRDDCRTEQPAFSREARFDLSQLLPDRPMTLKDEELEVVVKRESDGAVRVWNGVCPHEGGPLGSGRLCGSSRDELECSWHGRKFRGVLLSQGETARLGPLQLALKDEHLTVSSSPGPRH